MEQQEKMFVLVDEFQESGQSQKEFCSVAGIKPSYPSGKVALLTDRCSF